MTSTRSASLFALALLAPALIYILIIVAYPLFDTVVLSFTNASLRPTYDWVGWANYQRIFGAGNFTEVIIRTFVWTFFSVAFKMVIGTPFPARPCSASWSCRPGLSPWPSASSCGAGCIMASSA